MSTENSKREDVVILDHIRAIKPHKHLCSPEELKALGDFAFAHRYKKMSKKQIEFMGIIRQRLLQRWMAQ